jgi:hypothetical protein
VAKSLNVQGTALAELNGNYSQLTKDIEEAQYKQLEDAKSQEELAKKETGQEFINDMRNKRGSFTAGTYYANLGGGFSSNDENKILEALSYRDYKYLSEVNGSLKL